MFRSTDEVTILDTYLLAVPGYIGPTNVGYPNRILVHWRHEKQAIRPL